MFTNGWMVNEMAAVSMSLADVTHCLYDILLSWNNQIGFFWRFRLRLNLSKLLYFDDALLGFHNADAVNICVQVRKLMILKICLFWEVVVTQVNSKKRSGLFYALFLQPLQGFPQIHLAQVQMNKIVIFNHEFNDVVHKLFLIVRFYFFLLH